MLIIKIIAIIIILLLFTNIGKQQKSLLPKLAKQKQMYTKQKLETIPKVITLLPKMVNPLFLNQ